MIRRYLTSLDSGRFLRFGAIGFSVTLLHVVIAASLIETDLAGPVGANGVAFLAAALTSFVLNARYTFQRQASLRRFCRFLIASVFCSLLSMGIAGGCELLGWPYQLGILIVVCCVTWVSFLLHKLWTYA